MGSHIPCTQHTLPMTAHPWVTGDPKGTHTGLKQRIKSEQGSGTAPVLMQTPHHSTMTTTPSLHACCEPLPDIEL